MKKITEMTPQELNAISNLIDKLFAYYDNQAKANEGQYDTEFQEEERKAAKIKCNYYLKRKGEILVQMEKLVDETFA